MNNELFDRMIKENLQEMHVAPSAGVKKALGWKLFFQNMLVFHKMKVALGLLLVSGGTSYYFVTTDDQIGGLLNDLSFNQYVDGSNSNNEELTIVSKEDLTSNIQVDLNANEEIEFTSNEVADGQTSSISEKQLVSNTYVVKEESNSDKPKNLNSNSGVSSDYATNIEKEEGSVEDYTDQNTTSNDALDKALIPESSLAQSSTPDLTFEMLQKFDLADNRFPVLECQSNLISPNENCDPIPVLSNDRGMFGELSFDLFKGVMGQSEVSSDLKDAIHRQYYWDFHGEDEVLKMNLLGGANVSYSFGARMFRLKATTGISYFSVNDTKAVYEFEEITDPAWLDFFNTDELSWVNTYGKDTCTQCFYAQSTDELKDELEQEYNQYSYLRVPLQLGTQLNFKYVSLDLLGGLDINFLTKSRGLYVKSGLQENYERFYYWDNMHLSTLSKGNEMLKKSFMTWSAAANLRVRVSKNFDLLAGYQINKSIGNMTNDDYMMKKNLKSSNMTVGITFYPSRASLKPKF